jgi:hypothetical protein
VIQALTRAADRGIKVRIHLDNGRLAESKSSKPFRDLATTPDVEIRAKGKTPPSCTLRAIRLTAMCCGTGAAIFSASGLKRQDDDVIVIKDAQAAAKFKHASG